MSMVAMVTALIIPRQIITNLSCRSAITGTKSMTMRSNDLGGMFDQVIMERAGPAIIGFLVAISRTIYKGGRKAWRVTFAEAAMIAMATGTMGPIIVLFWAAARHGVSCGCVHRLH